MTTIASDIVDLSSTALTSADMADRFYAMYSRHTNICTHTPGTETIRFYNSYNLKFTPNYGSSTFEVIDVSSGDTLKSRNFYMGGTRGDENAIFDTLILSSPDLFYTYYLRQNPTTSDSRGGVLCFMRSNNKHYVSMIGGPGMGDRCYWYIEYDTAITCLETRNPSFSVKKIADYQLPPSDLFFTETSLIATSGGDYAVIPDFSSCSNVTYRNTIALSNKTYYAIGTNTLVEFVEET